MQKLIKGLHQFQAEVFEDRRELFERLSKGQHPDALFITCSDSRISPNLMMQTRPGDLFVMRNAGNIIPPYEAAGISGEAATIEFAIQGLNVKDIIICGHSHCGAVAGLLNPDKLQKLPNVSRWLTHAQKAKQLVDENYNKLDPEEVLSAAVQENVLVQLENLRTHPLVAERLANNSINIHAWVYQFETGEVFIYKPDEGQFLSLSSDTAHVERSVEVM